MDSPRFFENKNKVQDAHEAIRPTSVFNTPEKVQRYLSEDQYALYTLIWKRFVASQMTQALIDQKTISIKAGEYTFSVSGSTIRFPGFMTLYMSVDTEIEEGKEKQSLPEVSEGSVLKLIKIDPKQHFTQPPPRFSEASLVKELEENGIGRPSTYAAILSTIQDKGYVELVNKYFRPSELGFIVNDLLVANFPDVLNVDFTAGLESDLDHIETGETEYVNFLSRFYATFSEKLESAKDGMISIKGVGIPTDLDCPLCNRKLNIKIGKNGTFLTCSGYPECQYSNNYIRDEKGKIKPVESSGEIVEGKICEKCSKPMVMKQGKYGEFLACSGYPQCKHTESLNSTNGGKVIGVKCPQDSCDGDIVERTSKRGKLFYGCSKFPECTFASWDKPVSEPCPDCGAPFVVEKSSKRDGTFLKCVAEGCSFKKRI